MFPQIIGGRLRKEKSFFQNGKMKHPISSVETYEFNLGKARELRCLNNAKNTTCGECEACVLTKQLNQVKKWFFRAGDQSRKRFILGLVRRLHSVDILEHINNILQPLTCKDFMYSKARTNPSLSTDRGTISSDRALDQIELETEIAEAWFWFQNANYWTKSNYIMGMMRECEAHLLSLVAAQAKTLLASEWKAHETQGADEIESIASTHHSFDSAQRPDLDLLVTTKSEYSAVSLAPPDFTEIPRTPSDRPPTSPKSPTILGQSLVSLKSPAFDRSISVVSSKRSSANSQRRQTSKTPTQLYCNSELEIINDETEDEGFDDDLHSNVSSLDPSCMVMPNSIKAHSGVSRYKDFIRRLPVHLSKMILGYLDQVSLNNCVCVSKNWRVLAEEVHRECFVQQSLREEVMLMQGAAAQGCNPFYAKDVDVAVPNLALMEAISTGEDSVQTTYKSEVSFNTAYSGYSTRNIIMEERNVYCGAYNVFVLGNEPDSSRLIHTDAGDWIAIGSSDKKVRFISSETGKPVGPVISGHAGTVRAVAINQAEGYVLSGSYDTSIRKWSLENGKCIKILRGHTDTINCIVIAGQKVVSGAKDNACKVWMLETGKCLRTFKHKKPVTAVALGEDLCLSGCEAGNVKVWNMIDGSLIKKLTGHHEPVTAIRFDKWHIVTGSRDGYALAWSAQGDHKRCLAALRHPSEVLSVEFSYLRVITGSADGKMRIWNMLSGECLRIMRGNSRSDPIINLIAIGNRVTINTTNNMLVLNFEEVEYDYTLVDDKMPPMVQYSKYSDAPVRHQPYAYIRAQRMKRAGATNTKILNPGSVREKGKGDSTMTVRILVQKPEQMSHSAKSLSRKSMQEAKRIHSASSNSERVRSSTSVKSEPVMGVNTAETEKSQNYSPVRNLSAAASAKSVSVSGSKPPSRVGAKSKLAASFKTASVSVVSIAAFKPGKSVSESEAGEDNKESLHRRVSWAFEQPFVEAKAKELSLTETKSLLRSQIRAKGEVVPPDFIYLAVNAIQANMKPTEANKNMERNRRDLEIARSKRFGRPTSSPSRIDPKTKIPLEDLHAWDQFRIENCLDHDTRSESGSKISGRTSHSARSREKTGTVKTAAPITQAYFTDFTVTPVITKTLPGKIVSSIPCGRIIRPHTATAPMTGANIREALEDRPQSAGTILQRPDTAVTSVSGISGGMPVYGVTNGHKKHRYSTSAKSPSHVPMLMYSQEIAEKLQQLPEKRRERVSQYIEKTSDPSIGRVSACSNPMRSHSQFKLRTHEQAQKEMINAAKAYAIKHKNREATLEVERKQAWLQRVKSAESSKGIKKMDNKVKVNSPSKTVVIVT